MENYSYNNASYPDSGDSSPRSREIDFENPPPWEDQSSQQSTNYKVKFMCSFGGNITPRPHDNHLSYVGGETKILSVERNIKFASFISKLSALCDTDVCFKYQLPGEDLDALISVTNDDDLEHMMHEYDRLFRGIAKPARLRLFLFAVNVRTSETDRPASTDRERFVEALNSGHNSVDGSSPPPVNILRGNSNIDYMFNVEKVGAAVVTSPPLHHPIVAPVAVLPVQATQTRDERVVGADPIEIQRRIQELQRMQIGHEQQQSSLYQQQQQNRAADVINNNGGNGNMNVPTYAGDYYKIPEQKIQNLQPGYWQENKQISNGGAVSGNGYNDSLPQAPQQHQQQQPVYMIPASQGNVYHAPIRAQNPTTTQGFYAPPQPQQQQQQQLYRDQPPPSQPQQQMYNVVTSQPAPQQPKLVQAYPPQEMVRQQNMAESGAGGGGGGYAQVAYDSSGRQVYYTAPGGVMQPQQAAYHPQQQQGIAVNPGHEGKVVISKLP